MANWEAGLNVPDLSNLLRIADLSGFYLEWLGLGRGPKEYGAPNMAEEPALYVVDDPLEQRIMDRVRRLSARQKRALDDLLGSGEV